MIPKKQIEYEQKIYRIVDNINTYNKGSYRTFVELQKLLNLIEMVEKFEESCKQIKSLIQNPITFEQSFELIKTVHNDTLNNALEYYSSMQKDLINKLYIKCKLVVAKYAKADVIKRDVGTMEFKELHQIPSIKIKLQFPIEQDFDDNIYNSLLEHINNPKKYYKLLTEFDNMVESCKDYFAKVEVDKQSLFENTMKIMNEKILPMLYESHISYIINIKSKMSTNVNVKFAKNNLVINLPQQKFFNEFLKMYFKIQEY